MGSTRQWVLKPEAVRGREGRRIRGRSNGSGSSSTTTRGGATGGETRGWESSPVLQLGLAVCAGRLSTTASLLAAAASPMVAEIDGELLSTAAGSGGQLDGYGEDWRGERGRGGSVR